MKEYFKRLKTHPGCKYATFFTLMGFLAGAQNQSFGIWWHGGLIGLFGMGIFVWGAVLISNRK